MKTIRRLGNERGYILLVVYIVAVFITTVSIAFFARHQVAIQATERYQNRILAFNAAESGIDKALRELATSSSLRSLADTNQTYTSDYTGMEQSGFAYTISPVPSQPTLRRIDATGYAPSSYSEGDADKPRAAQKSDITVYCKITTPAPPPPLFEYGIYAEQIIALGGDKVAAFDSYNSNQGVYGGSNISSDGAFALNSTNADSIQLKNITVNGNVVVGNTGDPDTVIDLKKAVINGTTSTLPADFTKPTIPSVPEDAVHIDLGNVTGTRTLDSGVTYHCSSIKISGQGKVITTGAVKIYVDGEVNIAGQGMTVPDNHPADLLIYALTDTAQNNKSVTINGNGAFYGGIIAPNATVYMGGGGTSTKPGDFFGAVICKTFIQNGGNSAFHFDLAMKDNQPVDPNQTQIVRVLAWQELHSLAWGTGS